MGSGSNREADGLVRSVEVRAKGTTSKRPVTKLLAGRSRGDGIYRYRELRTYCRNVVMNRRLGVHGERNVISFFLSYRAT